MHGGPGLLHRNGGPASRMGGIRGKGGHGGGMGECDCDGDGGGGGGWKSDGNCSLLPRSSRACGMGLTSFFVGGQALCDGCRVGG